MDYQFRHDIYGLPIAKFSMGHESIGQWLSDELGKSQFKTNELINTIIQIENGNVGFKELKGNQLQLTLNLMSVEVELLENEPSNKYYEQEDSDQDYFEHDKDEHGKDEHENLTNCDLKSECGLLDFKQVVLDWLDFIS